MCGKFCTCHTNCSGVLISPEPNKEGNKLGSMSGTREILTTSRRELSSSFFFLQGKAPKEIHAILTQKLACYLPCRANNLSAPRYDASNSKGLWQRVLLNRGGDNSLARPGSKQARKHVRDKRDFNNIETRAVIKFILPARQGAEGNSRHSERNISLFPSWSG